VRRGACQVLEEGSSPFGIAIGYPQPYLAIAHKARLNVGMGLAPPGGVGILIKFRVSLPGVRLPIVLPDS
jgi:hypothetical protein